MNCVRGGATKLGIATVVAAGLLGVFSVAGASAAALTGEEFQAKGPPTISGCVGTTLTYTVSGTAKGPFPGEFAATGEVTHTGENTITKYKETFTIESGATTIKGTESLPSSPSHSDFATCNQFAVTDATYTAETPECIETGSVAGQGEVFVTGRTFGEPTSLTHTENFKSGTCTGKSGGGGGGPSGVCEGKIGPVTINGNLNAGPNCELNGTKVEGNVTVESGGSLTTHGASIKGNVQSNNGSMILISNSSVGGNVQTNNATEITVSGGSVGGNVQIQGTTGATAVVNATVKGNVQIQNCNAEVQVEGDTIGGDTQVQNDTGAGMSSISTNSIGGNLTVQNNSAALGSSLVVSSNSVSNNIQCQSNTPPPTGSGNKSAKGSITGQCEKLV